MLLDTHVLIWTLLSPDKLSQNAKAALETTASNYVSSTSLYEITLKGRLGKWPEVSHLLDKDLNSDLADLGFEVLPVTGDIMQSAGRVDWDHRDPFDRMIVATGIARNLPIISKDKTLDTSPWRDLQRVW